MSKELGDESKERKRKLCPYCDEEIVMMDLPYCKPCQVPLRYCVKCEIPVAREARVCPQCGAEIE